MQSQIDQTLISLNNPSTFVSTLNVSGATTLNNATTINSSLNVKGRIMNEEMNIVDASTCTNQYQLLISSPTLTLIQHYKQYNKMWDLIKF
jgi:hypothetical protein